MHIGVAQLNPTVGDVEGNTNRIIEVLQSTDADVLVTPEMSICGYPPRDLLLDESFVVACVEAVTRVASFATDCAVLIGHPRIDSGTGRIRNSISVAQHGEIIAIADKQLLPSYDVFDEKRYFEPGTECCSFMLGNTNVGIAICEDFWRGEDAHAAPTYFINPVEALIEAGCTVILSPSASPFVIGKHQKHRSYTCEIAKTNNITIAMCNQVGANDDLIFDGGSCVVAPNGLMGALPLFETGSTVVSTHGTAIEANESSSALNSVRALALGMRDYVQKTGHQKVFIGLSGGIDSALTATLASIALGKDSVAGILMPSRYSSLGSVEDAELLVKNLSIASNTLPIEHMHASFERVMQEGMQRMSGLASENVQARIRGLLLMAMANEQNALLLATGNKSELAVGYSTLYGDMAGALSVIGDVYKTDVWELSNCINEHYQQFGFNAPPIPEQSMTKKPSAELRPDQFDEDSLPPYEVLDQILTLHIDFDLGVDDIEEKCDIPRTLIQHIVSLVDRAQFKRDQASVILKLTPRSFGRGRRMPIVFQRNWSSNRASL